ICSHTLEDIRDPLFVCSELVRISKAGYIEVPSRVAESCRGWEHPGFAGLSHHRWLVEIEGSHVRFTPKYHSLHGELDNALPASYLRHLAEEARVTFLWWQDRFSWSETMLHGVDV